MSAEKTVSLKYLMQRALANHSINNGNWENDAIDWAGQAMRFIGKHVGFKTKICCDVEMLNYITTYPVGCEGVIAVVHNGVLLPLGADLSKGLRCCTSSSSIGTNGRRIADDADIVELNLLIASQVELEAEYAVTPTATLAARIVEISREILTLERTISTLNIWQTGRASSSSTSNHSYYTDIDILRTSFETGYIDMIYSAFPIDEEGYPLIIDDEYYIQAIEWYWLTMLTQKGYQHPIFTYQYCYDMFWGNPSKGIASWRKRASNHARMPSIQDQERFARLWEQFQFRRNLPNQLFKDAEQSFGSIY